MPISSGKFTAVDGTMPNCAWAAKMKCTSVHRTKTFFEMIPYMRVNLMLDSGWLRSMVVGNSIVWAV